MEIVFLRANNFCNFKDISVNTKANNIFLIGKNGQGKTNFLEALYFCAYASSFRGYSDKDIVKKESKNFSAYIKINDTLQNINRDVLIKFENNKKQVFLDGKKITDRKELLSIIPCIIFCHEDMEFVIGSPERRRWFFDQVLSLYDPIYLDDLRCYRKAIKSRNSILRDNLHQKTNSNVIMLLDALDQQCIFYGKKLIEKRQNASLLFSEIYSELFIKVTGITGMTVQYVPSWKNTNENEIFKFMVMRRPVDMASGISLTGPHRDKYIFTLNGEEYTSNASTGQRRLLALLLRVAQASHFMKKTGKKPILLLDDVLLEMDGEKRSRFIAALPDYDQAFFTFLPEEPFQSYQKKDTLVYHVQEGNFVEYTGQEKK